MTEPMERMKRMEPIAPIAPLDAAGRWPDDVRIAHVRIPPTSSGLDLALLDAAERERAARFLHDADRARYALTRAALRTLLGERLGVAPAALRFATTAHGKPMLADTNARLSFNVSHAGEHALIAMSNAREVGIDIERIDAALNWRELLDLVCTPAERRALDAAPPERRRECFFRCWSAKEALLKTLGVGIGGDGGMHALEVSVDAGSRELRPRALAASVARAAELRYRWLDDFAGYVGCVAYGPAWT